MITGIYVNKLVKWEVSGANYVALSFKYMNAVRKNNYKVVVF